MIKQLMGAVTIVLGLTLPLHAEVITGRPVQTIIATEAQTIIVDQIATPIVPRINLTCERTCAFKITISAAVDIQEPETTVYAEAIINDSGSGIYPYDLVPLVQNLPIGSFRAPLTWTWVTDWHTKRTPDFDLDLILFTNGKPVRLHSRSVTVEILEAPSREAK